MNESDSVDRRRLRLVTGDKEDRISTLPDAILCHILSFLPTNYAVATSILSRRWKSPWTLLSNLWFDDRLCFKEPPHTGGSVRFENFVNRVVILCESTNMSKFYLRYSGTRRLSCSKFWISSAIMHNVRELELDLGYHRRHELPDSIYSSKTLEILRLHSDFVIKIPPTGICFPSVKILSVIIQVPDNNLTERLFCMCPVLEDLSIEAYFNDDNDCGDKYNISSPTLKRLYFEVANGRVYHHNEPKVIIKTPNLEYLNVNDATLISYVVQEQDFLSKVFIDAFNDGGSSDIQVARLLHLLRCITRAKFLSLTSRAMAVLCRTYGNSFPTFPNLTHLNLEVEDIDLPELPLMLNSFPNLETFVFDKELCVFTEDERTAPLSMPLCSLLHVKKIEFTGFEGLTVEMELIKCLLKNSEVLNTMVIRSWGEISKNNLCQLLMFERGSKTCQVVFFESFP